VIADAVRMLAAAGCETPRLDAELLLGHVLGVPRTALYARPEQVLEPAQRATFAALVDRRAAREPVAYIVGRRAFRHLDLAVDRRVLIPRPETELLVEGGLDLPHGARVLDVGTGSGAVALTLAHERPDLRVTGSDSSPGALEVARDNAVRLGLEVDFVEADLLDGVEGTWDAILSNPPYVAVGDWEALAPEIRDHEPREALVAGADGLAVVRRLIQQAAGRTAMLAVEVGEGQAPEVAELARHAGFADVSVRCDLAGIERVVRARA
jgi:release factor glutamine methyltransferase